LSKCGSIKDKKLKLIVILSEIEINMDISALRKRIHEYVDQADGRLLTLINGMIEADKKQDWWDDLDPRLQASIDRALVQSESGEGRPHEEVMSELNEKYLR
jgi:hypothetical protein